MKLYSWGSNSHGQLGQGSQVEQTLVPTQIDINAKVKYITGGGKHTVLLTPDGDIFTCGDNDRGQLGQELTITTLHRFQSVCCPYTVVKVTCGWDFNLALTESCEVLGWGSNSYGQLGLPVEKVTFLSAPFKIFDKKAVSVGAGLRHSAVVSSDGFVFTAGFGRKGQLGLGSGANAICDKFTQVVDLKDCQDISCGEHHCVAQTKNRKFYSWGNNRYGQLGFDPKITSFSAIPLQIDFCFDDSRSNTLHSGWTHNFILTDKGFLISWGRNDFGQLGEERAVNWKPQVVKNLKRIKQISLGSHHLIALTESGEVLAWGWNEHGNCGNGSCDNVKQSYKFLKFSQVKLIGSGAAHSFLYFQYKYNMTKNVMEELEITDPHLTPCTTSEDITAIPVIDTALNYTQFFQTYLLPNTPCIINNISQNWPCVEKWIKNNTLNIEYFKAKYKDIEVPISNCGKQEFNVQKKCKMRLHEYLRYWEEFKKLAETMDCLYLKDWHFVKEFPQENAYRVPPYFASDWLNEYYDYNVQLNDDYRFVYIGPKGSWTPFHADVFTSYSWSVNICGRKKWILVPPGKENYFKDDLGNLKYDIDVSIPKQKTNEEFHFFEIIQEEGQGLFVPSGWHHQVWNLEDTISINHNWINGCNIHYVWQSLQKNLSDVMKEISDCRDMENWMSQCQLVLSASFGIDYQFFHSFLTEIAKARIKALKSEERLSVFGNWSFGDNHMKFDLRRILVMLKMLEKDENFLEIGNIENSLNHSIEFFDSLNSFIKSDDF